MRTSFVKLNSDFCGSAINANTQPTFGLGDPVDRSGLLQYYVSAFNANGESESNIVPVKIAEGACGPAANPDLKYADGILSMSSNYQLAYLYASLDQGPWLRLPEGEEFFSPSDGNTDIQPYLDQVLIAKPNARAADLEVWGWTNGGALIELGRLHLVFENTKLEYCDLVGEPCSGDVGSSFWTTKDGAVAADEIYDHSRTFRFNANTAGASHILVQISTRPFPDGFQVNSPYLVDAYAVPAGQGQDSIYGQFSIDFSTLSKPSQVMQSSTVHNPPGTLYNFGPQVNLSPFMTDIIKKMKENGAGADQQLGLTEPAYYIRIVPWDLTKPTGKPSNTITIIYKYMGPPPPLEIMSEQPPLYDIKIAEFHPERPIDPEVFGCVLIRGVDAEKLNPWVDQTIEGSLGAAYITLMALTPGTLDEMKQNLIQQWNNRVGQTMCPKQIPPPEEEESSWWDGLMEFVSDVFSPVTSLWNGVVDLWNGLKSTVVDAVASIIDTIVPGLCDNQTCKDLLMEGLNVAITACTGLPPNLPNAPDLTSMGLDYVVNYGVSQAVQQAGVDCDSECIADIRSNLSGLVDQANNSKPQPGCYSSDVSKYGYYSLCLPPGIDFDYFVGAFHETAVVVVQATRNHNAISPALKQYDYRLFITSIVKNDAVAGITYSCPVAMVNKDLLAPDPAEGILYQPKIMPLPSDAAQGTQFTVPISLDNVADAQGAYSYMYPPFQQLVDQGALDLETAKYCSARLLGSRGYTITIKAQLTCIDPETETAVQCPNSAKIQDIQQYTPTP